MVRGRDLFDLVFQLAPSSELSFVGPGKSYGEDATFANFALQFDGSAEQNAQLFYNGQSESRSTMPSRQ